MGKRSFVTGTLLVLLVVGGGCSSSQPAAPDNGASSPFELSDLEGECTRDDIVAGAFTEAGASQQLSLVECVVETIVYDDGDSETRKAFHLVVTDAESRLVLDHVVDTWTESMSSRTVWGLAEIFPTGDGRDWVTLRETSHQHEDCSGSEKLRLLDLTAVPPVEVATTLRGSISLMEVTPGEMRLVVRSGNCDEEWTTQIRWVVTDGALSVVNEDLTEETQEGEEDGETVDDHETADEEGTADDVETPDVSGEVAMGEPVLSSELLSSADVRRVLRRHARGFRYCYERELFEDPALVGEMVITATVAPEGNVIAAVLVTDSTAKDRLSACMLREVGRMVFYPGPGGANFDFTETFTFSPHDI